LRQPRNDVAFAAAQIPIEGAPVGIVEDEDGPFGGASGCLHDGQRDLGQRTGGQPLLPNECGNAFGGCLNRWNISTFDHHILPGCIPHQFTRINIDVNIARVLISKADPAVYGAELASLQPQ